MTRATASLIALLSLIGILTVAAFVSPAPQVLFPGRRAALPSLTLAARNISNTGSDSAYPLVGTDSSGAAYVVWLEIGGAYQIYFATNKSGSWSNPSLAATITYFGSDIEGHKGFGVGSDGTCHLVYRDADPQITNYDIWYAKYSGSWGSSSDIAMTSGASSGPACGVSPADGSILAVWMDGTRVEWELFGRAATVSGSWSSVVPLDLPTGYFPDVAVDSSGRVHLAWSRRFSGTSSVLYVRNDGLLGGAAWTTPVVVKGDTGEDWSFPKVDCDNSGNAIVSWIDGTAGNDEIFVRKVYADGSLSEEANVSESTAGSTECDVAVNRSTGAFYVAWAESGEVLLRSYAGGWSAITNVSSSSGDSAAPSLAVDAKGQVHIVWHEYVGGNYEIYYDTSGGSVTTTTTTSTGTTTSVRTTTISTTTSILIKPQPPLDLKVTTVLDAGRASKTVILSWQRNPANAAIPLSGVRIWRKRVDQQDIDFHPIAVAPGDALSYSDGPLSLDQRFMYALTAIPQDSGGEESDGSTTAEEMTSFPPLDLAVRTVTNSSLFRDEKINVLSWTNSPLNATVKISQFNIYRRVAGADAAFVKIASVAGTAAEFLDRKLASETYEYRVTAVDTGGAESLPSGIVIE
jgi:hypothetical protein